AAADDDHVGRPADCHLGGSGRVVDAAALELLTPLRSQPAVVGTGRDEQALGTDRLTGVEMEQRVRVVERERGDRRRNGEARPELARLHGGALGELAAGDASGKAEVVFDTHAPTRLAARPR